MTGWPLFSTLVLLFFVGVHAGKLIQRSRQEAQFQRVIKLLEQRQAPAPVAPAWPAPRPPAPPAPGGFMNADTIPIAWLDQP